QGALLELADLDEPLAGRGQRDVAAGDCRRARPAVGLQHVAVDHDRALAQGIEVDRGAQRAPDESLDLLRAPAALALLHLALAPVWRCRRRREACCSRPPPRLCAAPAAGAALFSRAWGRTAPWRAPGESARPPRVSG